MASVGRLAVQRFRWTELQKAAPKLAVVPSDQPLKLSNPFVPKFNNGTGRWQRPKYSLRRQADLIKHAKAASLLHLLPPGPKADEYDIQRAATTASVYSPPSEAPNNPNADGPSIGWNETWVAPSAPGSDVGARLYINKKHMFKGHKWQRKLSTRRTRIRVRLRDMDKRIHRYRMKSIRVYKVPTVPDRKFYLRSPLRRKRP